MTFKKGFLAFEGEGGHRVFFFLIILGGGVCKDGILLFQYTDIKIKR